MNKVITSAQKSARHNLRRKMAEWILLLRAKGLNRNRKLLPFEDVKRIGLLFDIDTKEHFRMIQDLSQHLSSKGKEVISAGYFPGADLPDFCVAEKSGYCFNHRETNFFGLPRTDFLKKYIHIPFDLLINLSQEDYFILKYIASLSHGSIKMGIVRTEDPGCYDISIRSKGKMTLENAIENIFHYLLILNKKEAVPGNG